MQARNFTSPSLSFRDNRTVFYVGVATAVIVVGITALAVSLHLRQQAEMRTAVITQNLVRSIEHTIEGMLDIIDVTLLTSADELSRQLGTGNVDVQSTTRFFGQQLKRVPHMSYLRAANEHGDVIYGPGVLSPPNNISDRDYFILLRDNPGANFLVSRHLVGRIAGKWAWLFIHRINKPDGSFGGVVFAGILADHIEKLFSQINLDTGGAIALRDAEMGLIARFPQSSILTIPPGDKRLSAPFVEALKANPLEGTYASGITSIDGISRTHSYRHNEKYGFIINVGIAGEAALADWRKQTKIVAGLVGLFIVATLVFAGLISRAWRGQDQEIVVRKQAETKLLASELHLRAIIENEPECIKVLDAQGRLVQMNRAGLEMFEADSLAQVAGHSILDMIAPEYRTAFAEMHQRVIAGESMQMEFEVLGLRGGRRWLETHAVPMKEDSEVVHLALTRDITVHKAMEEKIRNLAYYDVLTQLPNRCLLSDRLGQMMTAQKRNGCHGALLFLDLDNFKPLNDTYGHGLGDLLLIEVAGRLGQCVREMDSVARFGGDEFVVLLSELDQEKAKAIGQASIVAEKIRASLAETYLLASPPGGKAESTVEHHCTSSIGVVVFSKSEASQEDILKWADKAMYQAKESGGNSIRFYDS